MRRTRFMFAGMVALGGCTVPSDDVARALDAFETPRVELTKRAAGGFSLELVLVPRDEVGSPCPVLPGSSARLGTTKLELTSAGGYDDLTAKCGDVRWYLAMVPEVAGAKLEIIASEDTHTCALRDVYLSRELVLEDGGTWMRPSAAGTLAFRFADEMIAPPSISASLTPVDTMGPTFAVTSTTTAGVHTLELPMLAARDYTLHVETPPVTLTTACTIVAEPFADQVLGIVDP